MNEHTHKQFDAEMEAIRSGVLAMGGLVETQFSRAIALLEDDDHDAIDQVGADEKQINQMQVNLDLRTSRSSPRQPTAIDLRFVLMITKIVNELERVGDEIKKIAYKAAEIRGADRLSHVRHYDVIRTSERAREMLQMALDTFARLDAGAAAEVIDRDEEIDAAFSRSCQLIS
jgi:phosphate transport system protein